MGTSSRIIVQKSQSKLAQLPNDDVGTVEDLPDSPDSNRSVCWVCAQDSLLFGQVFAECRSISAIMCLNPCTNASFGFNAPQHRGNIYRRHSEVVQKRSLANHSNQTKIPGRQTIKQELQLLRKSKQNENKREPRKFSNWTRGHIEVPATNTRVSLHPLCSVS